MRAEATGAVYALAAYGMWGVAPVYWKALSRVPAPELLAYRVLWSLLVGALLLSLFGGWRDLALAARAPRSAALIAASAALLGVNWLVFLHAVETDRILDTSLGYYANPLVSVALGTLVLRERLQRAQLFAVGIAGAGVAQLALSRGEFPWIALALALSFALYGLARKIAPVPPLAGFALETIFLAPLGALYLGWIASAGTASVPKTDTVTQLLVAGAGVVTALPLLCFTGAAQRLRLSTLGLFQYLAPTLAFALAVLVYGEPFTRPQALCFASVWLALALYSRGALREARESTAGGAAPRRA